MKLTLTTKFKSLDPFAIDLPDFVILTGINGAGKTQLLTAILNNQLRITDDSGLELNQIKHVTSQTLSPNESAIVTREQLNDNTQNLLSNYNAYLQNKSNNPIFMLVNMFGENSPQIRNIEKIANHAKKDADNLSSDDILLNIFSKLQITI
jgi:predicted ATP-binding protein involved in virulence